MSIHSQIRNGHINVLCCTLRKVLLKIYYFGKGIFNISKENNIRNADMVTQIIYVAMFD